MWVLTFSSKTEAILEEGGEDPFPKDFVHIFPKREEPEPEDDDIITIYPKRSDPEPEEDDGLDHVKSIPYFPTEITIFPPSPPAPTEAPDVITIYPKNPPRAEGKIFA